VPTKTIKTIEELRELLASNPDSLFVRWSRGPAMDRRLGASRDQISGRVHAGLSAVKIEERWFEDPAWLARRLREYRFLRIKDAKINPWIMVGRVVGTDSDGYESIEITGECYRLSEDLLNA